MKKKIIRSVVFSVLTLLAGVVALGVFQVCLAQSLFLHALVAPINPRTISQPTVFTAIAGICQNLIPTCLFLGAAFLCRAAWLYFARRKNSPA